MSDIFSRFSPFVQDFIYKNEWRDIREVQIKAAELIFETENNLLLTTSTASGKTEAAFFPILTDLYENPANSFGVLYIAPLKSLINDQFYRMDELLKESGIPSFHWHGDVSASHKSKALKEPRGILQITPESLESMLINRSNDLVRIFSDLRYIVIDELHTLMGRDRGNQIICQICRIQDIIQRDCRRIGLSATIGDAETAAKWLSSGSSREISVPVFAQGSLKWRLGAEHFYIEHSLNGSADMSINFDRKNDDKSNVMLTDFNKISDSNLTPNSKVLTKTVKDDAGIVPIPDESEKYKYIDAGYEFIYECVKNKKSLVFSNSREETEYVTATLRQIAKRRGEDDIFSIHHGNLSASIREEAELDLKNDEKINTTCATVTLELGIDIGKLERVVQIESPNTVSSMLQRLGRSGRRENPSEMMMVFREEMPLQNTPLPQLMPWSLLQSIAITQLYIEERFIEEPMSTKLPYSLMFHQTLSILSSSGELSPARLASKVMSLPPFEAVTKEDYKALLLTMLENDFIEKTESGGLIIGLRGEKLTGSFKFYAVFKDSEDYTVRSGSDEIGTITTPPPVGDRFALAGRVWEVEELDIVKKMIFVIPVDGKMQVAWPGDYGEIHTKILERMRQILIEDTVYPYLKNNARERLKKARELARKTTITENNMVHLGGYTWCIFPWLGTRSFRTFRRIIPKYKDEFKISSIDYGGCYYITFIMQKGDAQQFSHRFTSDVLEHDIDLLSLSSAMSTSAFNKYDDFIPDHLLKKSFAVDRLRKSEIITRAQNGSLFTLAPKNKIKY